MEIIAVYRSDETLPFAIHLCDRHDIIAEKLVLYTDDTVTEISNTDYWWVYSSNDYELVDIMKKFERLLNEDNV